MKLNLNTDMEFQDKKKEIEDKIDEIINSSKANLSSKIKEQLKNEDEKILKDALKIIDEDLEEKRINIKKHFVSQIETITIEAFDNAVAKMTA